MRVVSEPDVMARHTPVRHLSQNGWGAMGDA